MIITLFELVIKYVESKQSAPIDIESKFWKGKQTKVK